MKTVIKKGIKIYSPKIKKQKKGKGSLQAICKNKRRVFLCFFPEDPGKKAADPGGAYCGSSSGYPFVSAWNLYLAWNNGSVPGAGTCENISASKRTGAWYVCQCGKRDSGVNTPTGVLSSGVCIAYAKAHLPELGDGVAVSLIGSRYENHKIQLKATVLYQLPFSILPVSKLKVTNSSVVHAWTGYDPKNTDNEGTDGGEMVYVTEYESVYHTSESCTHLDLSVHRGIKTQVEQKRNEYGGKYHACERCGGDSALVYYTEKGDCYHSQASCSGLKRTVRLVKKSEIQAYIQCERCRENAG